MCTHVADNLRRYILWRLLHENPENCHQTFLLERIIMFIKLPYRKNLSFGLGFLCLMHFILLNLFSDLNLSDVQGEFEIKFRKIDVWSLWKGASGLGTLYSGTPQVLKLNPQMWCNRYPLVTYSQIIIFLTIFFKFLFCLFTIIWYL